MKDKKIKREDFQTFEAFYKELRKQPYELTNLITGEKITISPDQNGGQVRRIQ